jgi:hypothetical protein
MLSDDLVSQCRGAQLGPRGKDRKKRQERGEKKREPD